MRPASWPRRSAPSWPEEPDRNTTVSPHAGGPGDDRGSIAPGPPHAPGTGPPPARPDKGAALDAVAAALACPVCTGRLARVPAPPGPGALICPAGHRFDIARQGQVSLLGAPLRFPGDDGQMIAARADFLAAGHFTGLRAAAAAAIAGRVTAADPLSVELGAGTAYHLTGVVQNAGGRGIALDVSKAAARRAARAHPDIAAVIADAWSTWPLADGAVDAVLSVFAPRNPAETARVLRPGGVAAVVAPDAAHLRELARPLGLIGVDADKARRLEDGLGAVLDPVETIPVRYAAEMTRAHAGLAAAMGPSAHHGGDRSAAIADLPDTVSVTVSARVSIFRARP